MNAFVNQVEVAEIKFTVKPAKDETLIYRAAVKRLLKLIPAEKQPKPGTEINVDPWIERNP